MELLFFLPLHTSNDRYFDDKELSPIISAAVPDQLTRCYLTRVAAVLNMAFSALTHANGLMVSIDEIDRAFARLCASTAVVLLPARFLKVVATTIDGHFW